MKTMAVLAVICCAFFLSGITAIPVTDLAANDDVAVQFDLNTPNVLREEPQSIVSDEVSSRQKRFTCGDYACAAHCIARGKRGGYCKSISICVCSK